MKEKISMQRLFLREFVKQLVKESKEILPRPGIQISRHQVPPQNPAIKNESIKKFPGLPPQNLQIIKSFNEPITKEISQISQKPVIRQPSKPKIPLVKPKPGYLDLGKLNFIIADPWVQSIECQGPEKNITVKKGNKILLTHVALNNEEINKIIDEFSIATKIPLAEGTLKAVNNNLMITAVVSEILGGRFVIQKTNPNTLTI